MCAIKKHLWLRSDDVEEAVGYIAMGIAGSGGL